MELATLLANKLVEGLISDEKNDDVRQAEDKFDKSSFTDFIKMNATTSSSSDGKKTSTRKTGLLWETLQIDEIQPHLLEHLEIRFDGHLPV